MLSPVKILVVDNAEEMGKLIVEFSNDPASRPVTVDALNQLLLARGIVDPPTPADIHNNIEHQWPNGRPNDPNVHYTDVADDPVMITIPSPAALVEGKRLAQALGINGYPLPKGYDVAYIDPTRKPQLTAQEWDILYDTRIGDYTIGKCM